MKKRLPNLKTDKDAQDFIEKDLSEYLTSANFSKSTFEFEPKDTSITFRVSSRLKESLLDISKRKKVPYQKVMREALEEYEKRHRKRA